MFGTATAEQTTEATKTERTFQLQYLNIYGDWRVSQHNPVGGFTSYRTALETALKANSDGVCGAKSYRVLGDGPNGFEVIGDEIPAA